MPSLRSIGIFSAKLRLFENENHADFAPQSTYIKLTNFWFIFCFFWAIKIYLKMYFRPKNASNRSKFGHKQYFSWIEGILKCGPNFLKIGQFFVKKRQLFVNLANNWKISKNSLFKPKNASKQLKFGNKLYFGGFDGILKYGHDFLKNGPFLA